jgi:hypothetical protein
MTNKSRYFLIAAGAVLIVGVGGGWIAYLAYQRAAGVPAGVPAEVQYVPANAALVAYANVRAVMSSDLRRELAPTTEPGSRKGHDAMRELAGVDLEKQVDHVLAYIEPSQPTSASPGAEPPAGSGTGPGPQAVAFIQGDFEQARVEQFIRDHGGTIGDYRGRHISIHQKGSEEMAVAFVRPDLIAVGQSALVRRALDRSVDDTGRDENLTSNAEMMGLIRDASGSTAWAIGYFDAVKAGMKLPSAMTGQVPPVRIMSARADVNGGVKALIKAEMADAAAAEHLREIVRGFIALARLQGGGTPEVQSAMKSVQLSGTGTTVQMTFAVSPDVLRALAPRHRQTKPDAPRKE